MGTIRGTTSVDDVILFDITASPEFVIELLVEIDDVVRCEIANSILMRVRKHRTTAFPESPSTSFGKQRRSTLPVRESSDNDVPRKPVNNIRGTTSFNNDVFERKLAEALGPMEVKTLLQITSVFRHL